MTTPTSQPAQPWRWEYFIESDEWLLTTPEYDPPVSFRATRITDKQRLLFARHHRSNMPREVAEVLVRLVYELRLFDLADAGERELHIVPGKILARAANVKKLWRLLPMGEAPASYFMRQGD